MSPTYPEIAEEVLTTRIVKLLSRRFTKELVHRYFNPLGNEPFSGNLFHTLGENNGDRFECDDLLSLNLLDVPVTANQILRLTSGDFDGLLQNIDRNADITELDRGPYEHAMKLWVALDDVYGFGPTRVSKLMARKRPNLLPIRDAIVNEQLQINGYSWWKSLAGTMRQKSVKDLLKDLAPTESDEAPTQLRVLDVAIWMHGSRSKPTREVRREFGVTEINPN